ncbi:MAG: RNA polymerase sigma factor region1.1 domain-containing protein, partial [Patescibacteria group bacterium]
MKKKTASKSKRPKSRKISAKSGSSSGGKKSKKVVNPVRNRARAQARPGGASGRAISNGAKKKLKKPAPKKTKKLKKTPAAKILDKKKRGKALDEETLNELIETGRPRGFVTDNEILYYFPRVEEDLVFLEEIYDRIEKAGIKVIETTALIDISKDEPSAAELKNVTKFDTEVPDAVQMYLKEIGRT